MLISVDESPFQQPLKPRHPSIAYRGLSDRLLDRRDLLLTAKNGLNSLPAMVRAIPRNGLTCPRRAGNPLVRSASSSRGDFSIHLLAAGVSERLRPRASRLGKVGNWSCRKPGSQRNS